MRKQVMVPRVELDAFLSPKSVAVIGASERPGSWGSFIMEGLLTWHYPGIICPVNHNAESVYGIPAYRDVRAIPHDVDLVILAIPEVSVEEALEACGAKGVKGISIVTAGFAEAMEAGRAREEALARKARALGMRLLGPNVSGTFNLFAHFNASAAPAHHLIPTPLAAVCQGSFALYDVLALGYARRMGVGKFVQTGNECDLKVTDFLDYFGKDPQVRGVVMYLETLRDAQRFMDVARSVTREKPVVVHKAARTRGGLRAARSHTGALGGRGEVYQGAFAQANVVMAPSMDLLLPLGHALVERPPMRGNRVGIVTMGGSWGVVLTDQLEERGLKVPELSHSLQGELRGLGMPVRASTRNPVDIGAAGFPNFSMDVVVDIGRRILRSGEVDALILHGLGRPGMLREDTTAGRRFFLALEKKAMAGYHGLQQELGSPVLIGCTLSVWESQAVHDLTQDGIPIHHRPEEIAHLLWAMQEYWRRRDHGD